jgi:hypothetical protein
MESGQSFSTCIDRGRDEKIRRWRLQICFELFVLYKMGHFKNVAKEVGVSQTKDFKNLLEAYVTIVVGWFDVNPSLLYKMEMFIKKRMHSWALCIRKGWHSFTSSYANGC